MSMLPSLYTYLKIHLAIRDITLSFIHRRNARQRCRVSCSVKNSRRSATASNPTLLARRKAFKFCADRVPSLLLFFSLYDPSIQINVSTTNANAYPRPIANSYLADDENRVLNMMQCLLSGPRNPLPFGAA